MVYVLGNDPKRVDLLDLGDCVYYKQQKVFSEAQFSRSRDLQRAVKKGSLTILKRTDEKDGDFELPDIALPPPLNESSPSSNIDELNNRIKKIEEAIGKDPSKDNTQIQSLIDKVNNLESSIVGNKSNEGIVVTLLNVIKKLEEKIERNEKNSDVIEKLDKLLNREPVTIAQSKDYKKPELTSPEEIYVPNVTVEDGNTHIKLNVRKIEKSDNVQDALKKLKELRNKQGS